MNNKYEKDAIGTRMKAYEQPSTSRKAFKGQPLIVRLDGSGFSKFTKGMKRPYDEDMSLLMRATMKALVDRFNATIGYTQSDEITLAWDIPSFSTRELEFDGRFQKLESEIAGYCSVKFMQLLLKSSLSEYVERLPYFDCRAFVVPSLLEAYHCFLWRQQDCVKNAISQAAQSMFKHSELQNMNGPAMQELMFAKRGVNFNDYPAFFKRGTFARRVKEERIMTLAELAAIPELKRPKGPIIRSSVKEVDIWLSKQANGVDVLFHGADVQPA